MINSIEIKNRKLSPFNYLKNNEDILLNKIEFSDKINIIIGPNGSGKSTIINLIKEYFLVDWNVSNPHQPLKGLNSSTKLFEFYDNKMNDGVIIKGDYYKGVFALSSTEGLNSDEIIGKRSIFESFYQKTRSSSGEIKRYNIQQLFSEMFSGKSHGLFSILKDKPKDSYNELLLKYYEENHENSNKFTLLFDEPETNLDITHLESMYNILSDVRNDTQIIAVIHNPILIYKLSKNVNINIIEMEDGYLDKINKFIDL